jgi:hypothetical protein
MWFFAAARHSRCVTCAPIELKFAGQDPLAGNATAIAHTSKV